MDKITDIRELFKNTSEDKLYDLIGQYSSDSRTGVQNIITSARKRIAAYEQELARVDRMLEFERKYSDLGLVCGIDEAGRGPLAGPVVASAVILDIKDPVLYVNDSKQLSAKKRELLYDQIMEKAVSVGVGIIEPDVIDDINILQADYLAMKDAFSQLKVKPAMSLNDAVNIPDLPCRQVSIIHGDALSLSIAAASIIAKVTRDRLMDQYDSLYPQYGFKKHKGYGTAAHIQALKQFGPCPIHRKTFITHFV